MKTPNMKMTKAQLIELVQEANGNKVLDIELMTKAQLIEYYNNSLGSKESSDVPMVQTEANTDGVLESLDTNNAMKRKYTKATKADELLLASLFVSTYKGDGNKSERSKAFLDTIKGFKYTDDNTGKLISVFARFIDNGFLLRTTEPKIALKVAKQANKLMTTVSGLQDDSGVNFGMSKSSAKKALAKGVEAFTELHDAIMERVEEFRLSNKGYYKA